VGEFTRQGLYNEKSKTKEVIRTVIMRVREINHQLIGGHE